jgi:hypothetical protein
VLFRKEEQAMRAKMVEQDWVEAVIGLGPNLFYNSPMESCIVICNRKKTAARKGKAIFIDAVNEVTRERAQSFLMPTHQQRILASYKAFADVPGFAKVATLAAHSTDRGHPFQADRGQRSERWRTPWVGCLSDDANGSATVRDERGTRPAGLSTRRAGAGWITRCRRRLDGPLQYALAALSTAAASPATNSRRGGQGDAVAALGWQASDAVRLGSWPGAATRP